MNPKETFYKEKESCELPVYHIEEGITDPELKVIDDLYGAADILSIHNAVKHKRILLVLSVIGTLLTMAFLLYDEAELHGLILACIFLIIFLFLIRRFADNLDCHRKYIEYRVLAETLRLQYFLTIAGLKETVPDIMPWFIKKGIPWIEEVHLSLPVIQVSEKKSVLDCWIRDQKTYHDNALVKAKNKKQRDNRVTTIVVIITIISYIVALLFEIYVFNSPIDNPDLIRAILKIVLGTMSAITIFTGNFYGKLSLTNTIKDHERMSSLYGHAEKEILKNGESEELLLSLAREYLIENSAWYSYQTKNKPDLVF